MCRIRGEGFSTRTAWTKASSVKNTDDSVDDDKDNWDFFFMMKTMCLCLSDLPAIFTPSRACVQQACSKQARLLECWANLMLRLARLSFRLEIIVWQPLGLIRSQLTVPVTTSINVFGDFEAFCCNQFLVGGSVFGAQEWVFYNAYRILWGQCWIRLLRAVFRVPRTFRTAKQDPIYLVQFYLMIKDKVKLR